MVVGVELRRREGMQVDGAKNGIHEIVEEILVVVPEAISCVDEEEHSALHLAVMYRHEHVFNFIIQQMGVGKK
ncbi:hypothetical protein CsSME_00043623 [Camellia sinensis var. sinensis]